MQSEEQLAAEKSCADAMKAALGDQLVRTERTVHQVREEATQMRETQSRFEDEVAAAEHHLVEAAAKGMEDFKQSEAFHEELLTSYREAFFTGFD